MLAQLLLISSFFFKQVTEFVGFNIAEVLNKIVLYIRLFRGARKGGGGRRASAPPPKSLKTEILKTQIL
jgi:hypothetical protein